MSGNFIYRHHVEPRVKLYSPREESFPVPLKHFDVSSTTTYKLGFYARKPHRWLCGISMGQEICLIIGHVSLSLLFWMRNLQTDICDPWRLDWENGRLTSRPDHVMARTLERKWERMPSWSEKQKVVELKSSKLEYARIDCEGSTSLTLQDKEIKETIKNARKKLETPIAPCYALQNLQEEQELWKIRCIQTND